MEQNYITVYTNGCEFTTAQYCKIGIEKLRTKYNNKILITERNGGIAFEL